MKKNILAGLMVVAFCITWWVVAGEAWEASRRPHARYTTAPEHFREQASWGIAAGLLVDVVLLAGILAWSKLNTKA